MRQKVFYICDFILLFVCTIGEILLEEGMTFIGLWLYLGLGVVHFALLTTAVLNGRNEKSSAKIIDEIFTIIILFAVTYVFAMFALPGKLSTPYSEIVYFVFLIGTETGLCIKCFFRQKFDKIFVLNILLVGCFAVGIVLGFLWLKDIISWMYSLIPIISGLCAYIIEILIQQYQNSRETLNPKKENSVSSEEENDNHELKKKF